MTKSDFIKLANVFGTIGKVNRGKWLSRVRPPKAPSGVLRRPPLPRTPAWQPPASTPGVTQLYPQNSPMLRAIQNKTLPDSMYVNAAPAKAPWHQNINLGHVGLGTAVAAPVGLAAYQGVTGNSPFGTVPPVKKPISPGKQIMQSVGLTKSANRWGVLSSFGRNVNPELGGTLMHKGLGKLTGPLRNDNVQHLWDTRKMGQFSQAAKQSYLHQRPYHFKDQAIARKNIGLMNAGAGSTSYSSPTVVNDIMFNYGKNANPHMVMNYMQRMS